MRPLFALLFLIFPGMVLSQESTVWTLERCIDYALEHNIDIQRQKLNVETKKIAVKESGWAFSPSFGISSSASVSVGRVLDQTTYQFIKNSTVGNTSASVYGSMDLFRGFRKLYDLKYSKVDLDASNTQLEVRRREITKSVIADYLALLCAESELEAATITKELIDEQYTRIKSLVELGRVTESDLIQARARMYAADNDVTSAKGSVEMARIELCDLLNIPVTDTLVVSHTGMDAAPSYDDKFDYDRIYELPELRHATMVTELASRDLKKSKSSYWPSLSMSLGYGSSSSSARQKSFQDPDGTTRYEPYPFLEQYRDNSSAYVSLSLNIPIFNAMSTKNLVRRKQIALKDAEFQEQGKKKEVIKGYYQARIDCETAYQKYLSSLEQVHYSEKAEMEVRERYNLGHADFNTWNTAATELAKARYLLLEMKYTCIFKARILEMY